MATIKTENDPQDILERLRAINSASEKIVEEPVASKDPQDILERLRSINASGQTVKEQPPQPEQAIVEPTEQQQPQDEKRSWLDMAGMAAGARAGGSRAIIPEQDMQRDRLSEVKSAIGKTPREALGFAPETALSFVTQVTDLVPGMIRGSNEFADQALRLIIGDDKVNSANQWLSELPVVGSILKNFEKALDASGNLRQESRALLMQQAQEKGGVAGRSSAEIIDTVEGTLLWLKTVKALGIGYGTKKTIGSTLGSAAMRAAFSTATSENMSMKDRAYSFGLSFLYQSTPALSGTIGKYMNSDGVAKIADIAANFSISATQIGKLKESATAQSQAEGKPENEGLYFWLGALRTFGSDVVFGMMSDAYRNEPKNVTSYITKLAKSAGVEAKEARSLTEKIQQADQNMQEFMREKGITAKTDDTETRVVDPEYKKRQATDVEKTTPDIRDVDETKPVTTTSEKQEPEPLSREEFNSRFDELKTMINPKTGRKFTESEIYDEIDNRHYTPEDVESNREVIDDLDAIVTLNRPTPPETPIAQGGPNAERVEENKRLIGIRNTRIDEEREKFNLPPIMDRLKVSDKDAWDDAMNKTAESPDAGKELIENLTANPRPTDKPENALLLHRLVEVNLEHTKAAKNLEYAQESGDPVKIRDASTAYDEISNEHSRVFNTVSKVKTLTAQALQSMKMLATEEFELSTMESHFKASSGKKRTTPLTKKERSEIKQIKIQYDSTLKSLEKKIAKLEAERVKKEKVADEVESKTTMVDLEKKTKQRYQSKAKEGESEDIEADRTNALDSIANRIDDVDNLRPDDIHDPIQKLALYFEQKDIDANKRSTLTYEQLVDKVHKLVKTYIPDSTNREVRDAISGYGKATYPSKEPAKVALRIHKSEMMKVAPLETVQKNVALLKEKGIAAKEELESTKRTGPQRDQLEARAREIQGQLNDAMREQDRLMRDLGITVGDPNKRLKTSLDAKKTRMKHRIEDIRRALKEQKKIQREKGVSVDDKESIRLKAEQDALLEMYNDMFPPEPMTIKQRVEHAVKSAERSLGLQEEKLIDAKQGIFPEKQTGVVLPDDARLMAIQQKRDIVKAEYEKLYKIAFPEKTPEEKALDTFKKRKISAISRLEGKISTRNFDKRVPKEIEKDDEAYKLERKHELVKATWNRMLEGERYKNRLWTQKAWDFATEPGNLIKSMLSSGDLGLSAILRQGLLIGMYRPDIAAKSLPVGVKAMFSPEYTYKVDQQLRKDEKVMKEMGVTIRNPDAMLAGNDKAMFDQEFRSQLADKIPHVRAAKRFFTTYLNKLAHDNAMALYKGLSPAGGLSTKDAKALGNIVNVAMGRGGQSRNAFVGKIPDIFWAPGLWASSFKFMLGQPLYHTSAKTLPVVAGFYGRVLSGFALLYTLYGLAGGETDTNPLSPEFGVVRFGDTRIDPTRGIAKATSTALRVASGWTKTKDGDMVRIRGRNAKPFISTPTEILTRHIRGKLTPGFGTIFNLLDQKDITGQTFGFIDVPGSTMIGLAWKDVLNSMEEHGVPPTVALTTLAIFGQGVNTYDTDNRDRRSETEKLMWKLKFMARDRERAKELQQEQLTPGEEEQGDIQ